MGAVTSAHPLLWLGAHRFPMRSKPGTGSPGAMGAVTSAHPHLSFMPAKGLHCPSKGCWGIA